MGKNSLKRIAITLGTSLVAIAADNSIYISNQGFLAGQGEVIQVQVSTPEPAFLLDLSGITIWGISSRLRSKKRC